MYLKLIYIYGARLSRLRRYYSLLVVHHRKLSDRCRFLYICIKIKNVFLPQGCNHTRWHIARSLLGCLMQRSTRLLDET